MKQSNLSDYESSGVECPECGREFKDDHSMKIHYGYKHEGSLAGFTHTCEVCEESFTHKSSERTYCSRECFAKGHGDKVSGKKSNFWNGGDIEKECVNCNDSFSVNPAHSDQKYCSQTCYGEDMDVSGENNPMYQGGKRVDTECSKCGDVIEVWEHALREDNFCSVECHNEWQIGKRSGKDNPQWKDGEREYGPGFTDSVKREVRKRDGFECQNCELAQTKNIESYGCRLAVHHICGARQSTNPAVYNAKRNLVALCSSCHQSWERHVPGVPPDITQHYDNSRKFVVGCEARVRS